MILVPPEEGDKRRIDEPRWREFGSLGFEDRNLEALDPRQSWEGDGLAYGEDEGVVGAALAATIRGDSDLRRDANGSPTTPAMTRRRFGTLDVPSTWWYRAYK